MKIGQVGLRRLGGRNASQAQFTHEAILQRGPQALDAALGLGRVGGQIADAELVQHATQVRGGLPAGQLFGQRPVPVVADEEIEAIAVEGQGQAVLREQLLKERGVAVDVLGRPEVQGEDLARGVVDGAEQHELGAAALEPGERTAVDLHEGPAGGLRHPAPARAGRAPGVPRRQAQVLPQPADRLAAERQAVLLAQLFGHVAVVEPDVQRRHQPDSLVARGGGQALGRGTPPTAVDQSRRPAGFEPPFQPPHLPEAKPQGLRELPSGNPTAAGRFHQPRPMLLFPAQREGLHGRRTFSRGSYPRTFSCSNSNSILAT
jgi:hypothetical protein